MFSKINNGFMKNRLKYANVIIISRIGLKHPTLGYASSLFLGFLFIRFLNSSMSKSPSSSLSNFPITALTYTTKFNREKFPFPADYT